MAILKSKVVDVARFQEWTEAQMLLGLPLSLALLFRCFCFSLLCLQTSFLYFSGLYGKNMAAASFWDQMEQIQTLPNGLFPSLWGRFPWKRESRRESGRC